MLKPFRLSSVDAYILHDHSAQVDGERLRHIVQGTLIDDVTLPPANLMAGCPDDLAHYVVGSDRLFVTPYAEALPKDALFDLSQDPFIQRSFPEAASVSRSHKSVTAVSFKKGMIDAEIMPDGLMSALGSQAESMFYFNTLGEVTSAFQTVASLTSTLSKALPSTAVVWASSGHFMPSKRFQDLSGQKGLLLQTIRPMPYGDTTNKERPLLGISLVGSEYFLGRRVMIEPSTLALSDTLNMAFCFLLMCQRRNTLFADDNLVSLYDDDGSVESTFRIAYAPPAGEGAPPLLNLTLEHAPAHGLEKPTVPTIQTRYDVDGGVISKEVTGVDQGALDPNDPVDAAILERLAAVSAENNAIQENAINKQTRSGNTSYPAQTQKRLKSNRIDINELRAMAKHSASEDHQQTQDENGVVGKLRNIFARRKMN